MRQFHQPMPDTVWNTLCLGLDTLLRTQGLAMQNQVNEATAFLGATPTQAQCLEALRQEAIRRIKSITRNWRDAQLAVQEPPLT